MPKQIIIPQAWYFLLEAAMADPVLIAAAQDPTISKEKFWNIFKLSRLLDLAEYLFNHVEAAKADPETFAWAWFSKLEEWSWREAMQQRLEKP